MPGGWQRVRLAVDEQEHASKPLLVQRLNKAGIHRRFSFDHSSSGHADIDAEVPSLAQQINERLAAESLIEMVKSNAAGRLVLTLGGVDKAHWTARYVFPICFMACFAVCSTNLYTKQTPYHNLPIELLTAYIHVPTMQGWFAVRRLLYTTHASKSLLLAVERLPAEEREAIHRRVLLGCRVAVVLMVGTTVLVWLAYSVPALLHGYGGGGSNYHLVHGTVMIFTIPPVISALLSVYIFVALFAQLHVADLQALKHEAFELIGRFLVAKARARILGGVDKPSQAGTIRTLQHERDSSKNLAERIERQKIAQLPSELNTRELAAQGEQHAKWSEVFVDQEALSEKDKRMRSVYLEMLAANQFNALCNVIVDAVVRVQDRIDATCSCLAWSFLHLLIVHTSQVMVVALNFEAHTSGNLVDIEYRWNWYFADTFHFGTGLLLMFSGLLCAVMVTEKGKQVIRDVLNHARKKGIRSVNRATLHSNMEGQLTGYTLAWGVAVTGEFMVMFFWAELLTLYDCFANAFQEY